MNHKSLGCLSASGILAGILTVLIVAGIGLARDGVLFNAGPLNAQAGGQVLGGVRSHAEIARCSTCHPSFWASEILSDRCLACHTEVADQFRARQGLHSFLGDAKGTACQNCHPEHRGASASLTNRQALSAFPHTTVGFSLASHRTQAENQPSACAGCHPLDLRQPDPAACLACHQKIDAPTMQAHTAAFGSACLGCHDGLETYGKSFDHQKLAFPLQGSHAQMDCAGCHAGARLASDLKAAPTGCPACHAKDDPHGGRLGKDCGQCHIPEDWKQAAFDHNLAGFQLTGQHVNVACEKCHPAGVFQGTPKDCYSCHRKDNAHAGKFGQDCARCHTPQDWKPAAFDHSLADFPLLGKHASVPCESCHPAGVFQGTPKDCYSCHSKDDAHAGKYGKDCAVCHTPDGWDQSTFDHSKTAFPLTGAHLKVDCLKCHKQDASGTVFRGTPTACASCHGEPAYHAGLFGAKCTDCHTTRAWSPAKFNRAHTFPLSHGGAKSCRSCHPGSLSSYTCYGCHPAAKIEGKHREEGIANFANCVRCHPTGQGGDGDGGD